MLRIAQRSATEGLGTALLLATVIGSGIMGERLSGGNVAIALLANSIATGAVLMCLIAALGPISEAHFNPAVTICKAWQKEFPWPEVPAYIGAQIVGAVAGAAIANLMFGLPAFLPSRHARTGTPLWLGEFVATFGLLVVIWGCIRFKNALLPVAVAGYIVGAYWFTSSTSFANPAVTIARSLSDTFAGIRSIDVPAFVGAQMLGALAATAVFAWIAPARLLRHVD
jgi:glycerol uptake facilitator-like aquaporin